LNQEVNSYKQYLVATKYISSDCKALWKVSR